MRHILITIACTLALFAKPAEQGLYTDQSVSGSINPLGVLVDSRILYRIPLSKPGNILFESTKIDVGLLNWFTPADDYIAAFVTIEPIAVFDITLRGGVQCLYRALGFGFIRLSGPNDRYDSDATAGLTQGHANAMWLAAVPRLKLQVWNIIFAHSLTVNYFNAFITNWYFERHTDSVHYGVDTDLVNETYLFYKFSDWFMAGINNLVLAVPSTGYVSERLSALVVFTPTLPCFYDFYAVIMAGSFITDHYYTGKLYLAASVGLTVKLF